jgi:hypothetical protein
MEVSELVQDSKDTLEFLHFFASCVILAKYLLSCVSWDEGNSGTPSRAIAGMASGMRVNPSEQSLMADRPHWLASFSSL